MRSEKNSVPACGFIRKLSQFQLESVWLSSSLLLFFLSSFYHRSCAQIYQLLSLPRTPASFAELFITATRIPLLWPTPQQLRREKEGKVVYFHRNCPHLSRMPWGSTGDSREGVSRKPSYHVRRGAAFQEQPPSCTAPQPPSTRKRFSLKQYGVIREPTSKEQTLIVLLGDLQKGRLIFHSPQLFPLLLSPFSALIKLMDI